MCVISRVAQVRRDRERQTVVLSASNRFQVLPSVSKRFSQTVFLFRRELPAAGELIAADE